MKGTKSTRSMAEAKRSAAFARICNKTLHGEVGGVFFDFRHQDLPVGEWFPLPIRHRDQDIKKKKENGQPFFWFPWFGYFDNGKLRQDVEATLKSKKMQPSINEIEGAVKLRSPDFFLQEGDKIKVAKVEGIYDTDKLEHPHDAQIRKAYLIVERKNGKNFPVPNPLNFYGSSSILGTIKSSEFFLSIEDRILKTFQIKNLDENIVHSISSVSANTALKMAKAIKIQISEIMPLLDAFPYKSKLHEEAFKIWDFINASAYLGYSWAKAENDLEVKPLALARKNASLKSRIGGVKGAKARKAKQQKWQRVALAEAGKIIKKKPSISLEALSKATVAILADQPELRRQQSIVKKFLKESGHFSTKKKVVNEPHR